MARAGFCSGCGANVWLTPQGGCVNGHGPEYISGAYEVAQAPAQTVAPVVAPPATYAQPSAPGYPAPLPAEPPRRRTGMIVLIVVAVSIVFLCGCGVLGLTLFGAQEFQSQSDDAVARSCAANLRTLDGAVQVWLAEHEGGDIGAID